MTSTSTATATGTDTLDPQDVCTSIARQLTSVVAVGDDVVEPILVSLFARGHALIEGIPGIGKTLLARTLARCVDCSFNRMQFTNDLMPSDIVGSLVWRPAAEKFTFVRGPLFANIVLADEINRTSPRTLSCLLEAMENGNVSVEGRTMTLADPFLVLATRNPIEFHGTYPVPEAALDRFLLRVELDYPAEAREIDLYRGTDPVARLGDLQPVLDHTQLLAIMGSVQRVAVSQAVADYCYRIVRATRNHDAIALGASPRAAMSWLHACRARALMNGRDYVLPDDLKALARPVLTHRIFRRDGGEVAPLLEEIVATQPVGL